MLHCSLSACYNIYKSRLTYYSKTPFILLSSVSIFLDAADAAADIFFVIPVQFLLIHLQIARLRLQNVFINFYCLVVTGVMDRLEEAGFLRRERHE